MEPIEAKTGGGGLPGALRAAAVIAILVVALIGVLAVLEIIPREALQAWFTKLGLVAAIVIAAIVALALLMRAGRKP